MGNCIVRTTKSNTVVLALAAYLTALPDAYAKQGLVFVPGPDGQLEIKPSGRGFARQYGPNGEDLSIEDEQDDLTRPNADSARPPIAAPEILDDIQRTAEIYVDHRGLIEAGLTPDEWAYFFRANIEVESGYRADAASKAGAYGLGQLMPETAHLLGVDRYDPIENLDGSARYLLMMLSRFENQELALAAYNAGPVAVEKYGGIPPYAETQNHVRRVMRAFRRLTEANNRSASQ